MPSAPTIAMRGPLLVSITVSPGTRNRGLALAGGEVDLRVHSRIERAGRIGGHQDHEHGSRGGVERDRNVVTIRGEDLVGAFLHAQFGGLAGVNILHVGLRNVDEDAQRRDLRDAEHFLAMPSLPALIRVPISTVARRDDAIKGRGDAGESLHLLQALDVGFAGVDGLLRGGEASFGAICLRLLHVEIGLLFVVLLLGYGAFGGEMHPSGRG